MGPHWHTYMHAREDKERVMGCRTLQIQFGLWIKIPRVFSWYTLRGIQFPFFLYENVLVFKRPHSDKYIVLDVCWVPDAQSSLQAGRNVVELFVWFWFQFYIWFRIWWHLLESPGDFALVCCFLFRSCCGLNSNHSAGISAQINSLLFFEWNAHSRQIDNLLRKDVCKKRHWQEETWGGWCDTGFTYYCAWSLSGDNGSASVWRSISTDPHGPRVRPQHCLSFHTWESALCKNCKSQWK